MPISQRTLILGIMALVLVAMWVTVVVSFTAWFIVVPAIGTIAWSVCFRWIKGPPR